MATTHSWGSFTSRTTGISAASISDTANSLGSEIDNSTNKDTYANFTLAFTCGGGAPTGIFKLWLVTDIGNGAYEDGDGTPTNPARAADVTFGARGVTSAQRQNKVNVPIPGTKLKPLLRNETGQNATSVTLLMYTGVRESTTT